MKIPLLTKLEKLMILLQETAKSAYEEGWRDAIGKQETHSQYESWLESRTKKSLEQIENEEG